MKTFTRRAFFALSLSAALGVAGCGGGSNGPTGATNNANDVPVGKIVYVEEINGSSTFRRVIYLRRAGDAGRRLLESKAPGNYNSAPALSPDGSRVAFVSLERAGNAIYTVNADGSDLKRVTGGASFDNALQWTSDGKNILFLSERASGSLRQNIALVPAAGGTTQTLIAGESGFADFALSPNGRILAYIVSDGGARSGRVVVAPISGTDGSHFVAEEGNNATAVTFSPDNQSLAVSSDRIASNGVTPLGTLSLFKLDGSKIRDLPIGDDLVSDISCSPDGQYLAYEASKFRGLKAPSFPGNVYTRIRIINADGKSAPRDLGVAGSTGDQSSPSWGR